MKEKILQRKLNESLTEFKDNIAIEYASRVSTYADLDSRSNAIANWIIHKGIQKETFIGIIIEDKLKLISLMIGILKAGCVFMPLDCTYPKTRLEVMIHSTHTKFVFIDGENFTRFITGDGSDTENTEFILIDDLFFNEKSPRFGNKPEIQYSPEDKIYSYFTSGTTGTPKAIIGKNKGLWHFIKWEIETFGINKNSRVSQLTSPGFDAFLRDVFVPLCSGGTICIPGSKEIILNPDKLLDWIEESKIHLIHCVPALFRALNSNGISKENLKNLKFILLSGERINPSDLVYWYDTLADRIQLVNLWGTSETTLAKTCYFIRETDIHRERIPVGMPIRGARAIVMDNDMNLCKQGVVGELYIRTPYRTFGYYNDPTANKERFIENPFVDDPNDILHKTGDLGRLLPDGNIDVIGRIDRQVKIRGIRIELEEIESILIKHQDVKEAVVIKKEGSTENNEFLCAFVTGNTAVEEDAELFTANINEYLSKELPDYMIPSKVIKIKEIPRKPSGKVDYNLLPEPSLVESKKYVPPGTDVERKLEALWSEILKIKKVGINHHFFDLGGNSLNIMTLITGIHKEFNVRLSLAEIFENLTIADQAKIIIESKKDIHASIKPVEKKEYYALSSAQKRLYFLYKMAPRGLSYNNLLSLEIKGNLDKERLEESFKQLVEKHESIRTSFIEAGGEPVQQVHDKVTFGITWYETKKEEVSQVINQFKKPFDLNQAPLLRVGLTTIDNDKERCILMWDMHHIITDGTSVGVMEREFMTLYDQGNLPGLRVQYKDYSQWQNSKEVQEWMKSREEYWLKEFEDKGTILILPNDFQRPAVKSTEGDFVNFEIGEEETAKLETLAMEEDATMYMVMLAITNVMLSKICGQEDIVVGTGVAGRVHSDLQNIIGLFVNALPLRNYPRKNKTFKTFLRKVKERTLKAFENQEFQFEELVEKLALKRDPSRNPLFDVTFEMQNIELGNLDIPGTSIHLYQDKNNRRSRDAKFDLSVTGQQAGKKMFFVFEYCSKLFKKETIEKFVEYFKDIIACVLENKNIELKDIKISHGFVDQKLFNPQVDFNF